ncbi:DUF397 domain-containing protein [Streptomyces sp. GMY02]|uniref:DUF397 domain-containing protein n=1 Tax=Streptomyces sp. GMY02 TaxID=1333528 RepID=UPI001C2CAA3F|nr:DUF397 domain-containing protein [Streptomyces sp. GMY02]QXE35690.1 DUF397 domain-containing protein [Streptomyces sp. GMY02]
MNSTERFVGWRKSSYSGAAQGECLEVAEGYASVPVRDSKNPAGPTLLFQTNDWSTFITAIKDASLTA